MVPGKRLCNKGVEVFEKRRAVTTGILQAYVVPPHQLEPFLARLRCITPACRADLFNGAIRFVHTDHDSFLRSADQDLFALVLLVHQPRTRQADQGMAVMAGEAITAALAAEGRSYLPYRLHTTPAQ